MQPLYKGRTLDAGRNPPPTGALTMPQAVDRALRCNPGLGSEEAQQQSSEDSRKAARGAFGPALSANYAFNRQENRYSPATTARGTPRLGTHSWGIQVTQPIFQGFNLLATYQKAALQAESDNASVRNAELSLTAEVQREFLNYLRYEENARSLRDALGRLQEQLRITRAFFDVGLRPRLDVLQAEVDVRQAESALIQVENSRDTSLAMLNTLVGLRADARVGYSGKLMHVPFNRSLEQCMEAAYRQRPDLHVAALAVDIAGKTQQQVQSGYFPQIEGYYSTTQSGNTLDMRRLGGDGANSSGWEAGVSATWNIFQWGTTYYADKAAGGLVTKMRYAQEELRLNVGYDVKSRFLAVREASKRIGVAQKAVEQAAEAYRAAVSRYQLQVSTNFDVLDASANLTTAEADLTGAKADYLTALSRLYVAMGEYRPDLMRGDRR